MANFLEEEKMKDENKNIAYLSALFGCIAVFFLVLSYLMDISFRGGFTDLSMKISEFTYNVIHFTMIPADIFIRSIIFCSIVTYGLALAPLLTYMAYINTKSGSKGAIERDGIFRKIVIAMLFYFIYCFFAEIIYFFHTVSNQGKETSVASPMLLANSYHLLYNLGFKFLGIVFFSILGYGIKRSLTIQSEGKS